MGPILFNSYITPASEVAQGNQVIDEKYANDEQLVLSFKSNFLQDQTNAVMKTENCIADFLDKYMLCNNSERTELLIIGKP